MSRPRARKVKLTRSQLDALILLLEDAQCRDRNACLAEARKNLHREMRLKAASVGGLATQVDVLLGHYDQTHHLSALADILVREGRILIEDDK